MGIHKSNHVFWGERHRKQLVMFKLIPDPVMPQAQEFCDALLHFHHAGSSTQRIAGIDAKAQKGNVRHRKIERFIESQLFSQSTTRTTIDIGRFSRRAAIHGSAQPFHDAGIIHFWAASDVFSSLGKQRVAIGGHGRERNPKGMGEIGDRLSSLGTPTLNGERAHLPFPAISSLP